MNEKSIINITEENFESIKHIDENSIEYWFARELMQVLVIQVGINLKIL